jgi:hypothetical protein
MAVIYDGIPQMSNRCSACGDVLSKGRLARTWNNMTFCNEYDQAAYMMRRGYAHWDSSNKPLKCVHGHVISPLSQHMTYKKNRFCGLEELAQWLRKNSVGMDCVIGENVCAL